MKSKLIVLCMMVGMVACSKSRLENVVGEDDTVSRVSPPTTGNSFVHPPTADVEVIDPNTGNATTVVEIGREYIIRPTVDTVDTDGNPFVTPVACKNDGIQSVQISVVPASEGSNVTRQRRGCEEGFEDITYKFTEPGKSTITMITKTDEPADSSKAVATVEAFDPNVGYNGNNWFDLSATKLAVKLGPDGKSDPVSFSGFCQTAGQNGSVYVHPEPGKKIPLDNQTYTTTHQYEKVGVYEVKGFCMDGNRDVRESIVTVVVLPEDGSQISPTARFSGDGFDFNDFPNQNGPSQNSPSQNVPFQNAPLQNVPFQNAPSQNVPFQN